MEHSEDTVVGYVHTANNGVDIADVSIGRTFYEQKPHFREQSANGIHLKVKVMIVILMIYMILTSLFQIIYFRIVINRKPTNFPNYLIFTERNFHV